MKPTDRIVKDFNFGKKVISLFEEDEELTIKELAKRSKKINECYPFSKDAINKVLSSEAGIRVIRCGKNNWKLIKKTGLNE